VETGSQQTAPTATLHPAGCLPKLREERRETGAIKAPRGMHRLLYFDALTVRMSTKNVTVRFDSETSGQRRFTAGEGEAMGGRSWNLVAGFILAGTVVWTPAATAAVVNWSGAGWYVSDVLSLMAGPYSTKADCQRALSALPPDQKGLGASCEHVAKNPLKR
jgi:hypothetical protein